MENRKMVKSAPSWSWKAGEFQGIGVYIHATFLLLIGWIVLSHTTRGQGIQSMFAGVAFTLSIFACVLLHEFGHALAARRFGIGTKDITLLPIGGVARLERMPREPKQELVVALAGPAVNILISIALLLVLLATGNLKPLSTLSLTGGPFLERLMIVNLFLVLFNMIPAFPMDGGRVLRALLAMRMQYARATRVAAGVGQGAAVLFGIAGFFGNPFLLLIAVFVWIGAAQESAAAQATSTLGGVPVRAAVITEFQRLEPHEPVSRAIALVLAGSQQDFPVVEAGRTVGMVRRDDLFEVLARQGGETSVREVMVPVAGFVAVSEGLESALEKMQSCGCSTIPVVGDGRLLGLLTAENVAEFMIIKAALAGREIPAIPQFAARK